MFLVRLLALSCLLVFVGPGLADSITWVTGYPKYDANKQVVECVASATVSLGNTVNSRVRQVVGGVAGPWASVKAMPDGKNYRANWSVTGPGTFQYQQVILDGNGKDVATTVLIGFTFK